MNRDNKLYFRLVVVGCALLLTLSVLSATAGSTRTSAEPSTTTGVGAETVDNQPIERTPIAAAQTDEDCVVDSFGSVYPELVEVRCTESESGDTSLALGGSGGWAYVMYLEIPPGTNNTGILGRGGEVIPRIGDPTSKQVWPNRIPKFGDEVVIVTQSSFDVESGRFKAFAFAHEPGSIFQSIPPGVYNLRVVVYQKLDVTEIETSRSGLDYYRQLVDKAPRKESELTVELGPCEADYNAEQRLENVDENILDTYEELGEAKAKYSEARRSFGDNVRSLTDSILSGGTKAALKKGAKLKDILTGAVDLGDLNTVASIQDDLEKRTQAQKSFDKRVTDVRELQSKKSAILDGVERCNGEPYNIERYDALSPSELQDAMNAGSDGQ